MLNAVNHNLFPIGYNSSRFPDTTTAMFHEDLFFNQSPPKSDESRGSLFKLELILSNMCSKQNGSYKKMQETTGFEMAICDYV